MLPAMPFRAPRGALLNTLTVLVGSGVGLTVGEWLPERIREAALVGIGLVTLGLGIKMFLATKNVLIVAGSVAVGGVIGAAVGIDIGLDALAEWARLMLGAEGRFNEGFITAAVLFCVGPMTLLGCLQDGLEGKLELLGLKSLLDGIAAVFLAAALGPGVMASAAIVLLVQGSLTLGARVLEPVSKKAWVMDEATAAGGAILLAIGINLALGQGIRSELYLPALVLAPLLAWRFPPKQA